MTTETSSKAGGRWGLEWWYAAHFAYGAIQIVFIPILIPTYVLEVAGSATEAGLVMGIIGLGGLTAPILGGLADKYGAHRAAQHLGLLAYAAGGVVFALGGSAAAMRYVGALCMGVGSATMLMINPAFIVSGGFAQKEEATRLTRLSQIAIVGSLVAGLGLGGLTDAGLSFAARFLVLSGVAVAALLVTAATNRVAAERLAAASASSADIADAGPEQKSGIVSVLFSPFGLYLLAVFMVTVGHGVITGQYPNYMNDVFGIDASLSATWLSVSAIVSLIVLGPVGVWMGRKGPSPVWLTAVAGKTAIAAGLVAVSLGTPVAIAAIPLGLYVIFLQGISWADMVQPAIATRLSRLGAGATQGMLLFSIAIAYATGNVVGGAAADALGFASLPYIVGAVAAVAVVLGFLAFRGLKQAGTAGEGSGGVSDV